MLVPTKVGFFLLFLFGFGGFLVTDTGKKHCSNHSRYSASTLEFFTVTAVQIGTSNDKVQ